MICTQSPAYMVHLQSEHATSCSRYGMHCILDLTPTMAGGAECASRQRHERGRAGSPSGPPGAAGPVQGALCLPQLCRQPAGGGHGHPEIPGTIQMPYKMLQ